MGEGSAISRLTTPLVCAMADEKHLKILQLGVAAWNEWRKKHPEVSHPNLREAHLSRADLSRANLRGASLNGADFSGANLSEANLSEAFVGTSKAPGQLPDGFPKGWVAPPSGWELYDDNGRARLRRSSPSPQ